MIEIITVTKDDLAGLVRTIDSTRSLREDFNIKQIIIDSSNEEISKKNRSLVKQEKNVTYFWQKPSGISSAFNFGINNSDAKWLWFLNGGDAINPDMDINSFLYILNNSYADTIIYQIKFMQTRDILQHPNLWSLWPPVLSWVPHPSTIVRKRLFDDYGLFDENLKIAMDYEIWLRFFSKNIKVDIISIPLVIFDQSGLALTRNNETKREVSRVLRRYFWVILKKWFWQLRIIAKAFIINSLLFRCKNK